ncbi:MAG: Gfo/Idh/MocA family oxidoreductase [Myxococcales bacterium]|nr:Gfo/Idh/MocA family oxidoreductase [Myxococcales bacterium]
MSASEVSAVVIGAGQRARESYGKNAAAAGVRYVAVAEPDPQRRQRLADEHGIEASMRFASYDELLAREQLADAALVCTQDQLHAEPAVRALERGYHVLLEKPMAPTLDDCARITLAAEQSGRVLMVCHVLRFAPFFEAVHEIVSRGELGDLITVEQRENVSYWHMAHSFVRGHWRSRAGSSPMILAKCCHDLDLLCWNIGRPCRAVSSFGELSHYRRERAPLADPPERCTDGCPVEAQCLWSAIGIYLEYRPFAAWTFDRAAPGIWPFSTTSADQSHAARLRALEQGPYGRCVYRCDNDVVDHQVVTLSFDGGVSAVLVMQGHSHEEHRTVRYEGTRAVLRGRLGSDHAELTLHHKHSGRSEPVPLPEHRSHDGHAGGDERLLRSFVRAVRGEAPPLTTARASLESHLIAFAADEARLTQSVVQLDSLRRRVASC